MSCYLPLIEQKAELQAECKMLNELLDYERDLNSHRLEQLIECEEIFKDFVLAYREGYKAMYPALYQRAWSFLYG